MGPVLKHCRAGAAFVPIDSLELGMIQPIFEKLNSKVAISSEHAAPVLSNLFDRVVIVTDDLMNSFPSQGPVTSMAAPSDAACILFVPLSATDAKGITFSHAALSTALLGQGPAARITPLSRVMQLSSFNVDICISEIFTTLAYGGCVCVPSAVERLQDFGAAVNRMQVNWSYMTPHLSRKVDPTLLPSLRVVCFRTRGLDEDTYSIWHGKANVVLAYGPLDVCPLGIAFLEAMGPHHLKSIGRPFAGNLLVVNPDDHKKRVPVGAVGELVIEAPTIGVSYPNRESMLSPLSPLGPSGKTRYLKPGHRVRYTQGGLMEFISSAREEADRSNKAVNVTEVEQHVRRCLGQGVDTVVEVVTFRGASKSDSLLAAFIELGDRLDSDETLTSLSSATKEQLAMAKQLVQAGLKNQFVPSMIPSVFIPVKHLPVTPSLKVNRRRLQKMIVGLTKHDLLTLANAPNSNDAKFHHLKPLPLTQSEEKMRAIWARVLGVEEAKISAHDTFFGVGGDDIVAAQLVAACRRESITVPIADVVRNATLTELSRAIVTAESPQIVQQPPSPVHPETSATSTPSPALPNPNAIKEVFIDKVIAPKIGVDGSAIADAAEASSAQIRYIETGMLSARANVNYLVFNFTGAVDPKKLEDACKVLVRIHPILRTAFVPYNRRVYMAVMKSIDIDFRRETCATWRLANTLDKVIKKDQSTTTKFETPVTKFIFLDGGKQSILILRLSKAQYDDLSVALLVKDLKRLYDGSQKPPRRPTYCDFVRCAQLANANGAEEYWRALLEGAVMTQVVAHTQPYQISSNVKTIRNPLLPLGSLSTLGISFETVLKAAWAMVLANLSASSDIVFGELVDGRHVRLPGGHSVAGVMGPTINANPVRVQFPDTALTPLNLLQYIHAQRMTGIQFENFGSLTIVEKCTPWPYWTRFSTLVQHQFEDTAINPDEPKSFHLGAAACKFTINEAKAQDVPDFFVRSLVRPPGRVEISITFCADRIPEPFAEHALRMLSSTISLLTSVSIMQPVIPCGYQYRNMAKRIPLPPSAPPSTSASDTTENSTMSSLSDDQVKAVQTVISDTWTSILNPRALGVPDAQIHNAAFFDLWGSLIPASQMTQQLNRELPKLKLPGMEANIQITMEEIVENPTMLKQFELISSKIKPRGGKEAVKSKEKEKDKDGGKDAAEKSSPNLKPPPPSSHRRKGSLNNISLPGPTTSPTPSPSFSSRLRRFASTVTRTTSPPANTTKTIVIKPLTPSQPPPTPTTPVAIGLASVMVQEMTQLSPRIIQSGTTSASASPSIGSTISSSSRTASSASPSIPSAPPQLPNLPAFDPIAEEAEPTFDTTAATAVATPGTMTVPPLLRKASPNLSLQLRKGSPSLTLPLRKGSPNAQAGLQTSPGESTTVTAEGSPNSNPSNTGGGAYNYNVADESADTLGPLPSSMSNNANTLGITMDPSTPKMREEMEDLVSPLSAVTPKSAGRYFGGHHGGGGGVIASTVSSPDTPGKGHGSTFGRSPVVG